MIKKYPDKYPRFYEEQRKVIDKKLKTAVRFKKPRSLYEPANYILSGTGKRLRPLLVLFACKAVGGKLSSVYNAALSVEMLHNFTLVHDDIMDNADLRRGKLTLHKKYDLNSAILAGDSLLSVAYEFLLKDCENNARLALSSFTKGLIEVCEGQSLDTGFETRESVSINEYIEMIRKKTAAMIQMCCELGGYLANGKTSDIKALSDYGNYLGIAFQIQDDLLDIIADETEFGKVVGGDLMEGKKTYLFLRALDKSRGNDKLMLRKVIKNKGISLRQVPSYKKLYEKLGVIDDARNEIKKYTDKALKSIDKLSNKKDIELFYWLADLLIKRNK